jgi:hypothetical protein
MSREAMKHIKTWHERCEEHPDHQTGMISEGMIQARMQEEIDELRKALETEPFEYWNAVEGWVKIDEVREHFDAVGCGTIYKSAGEGRSPLYTAPPKAAEWVGLTDEQVEDEWERITGHSIFGGARSEGRAMYISPDEVIEFSRAIEAKLKEKNT